MKICKKIIAILLCAATMLTLSVNVFAEGANKGTATEEVIYIMTDASGKISSVNAVQIFGKGQNIGYGALGNIKILNTNDTVTAKDGKYSFSTDANRVYVQGSMNEVQIPWEINIRYELDGKEYSPQDIAGKDGNLKITFTVRENENCNNSFWGGYALQATFTLDSNLCSNIVASGATVANVGNKKQITYTILPGKGIATTITADVCDFEMDAIQINGVKLAFNIEIDDAELKSKIHELTEALGKLDDGANTLYNGTTEYKDGVNLFSNGISELASGTETLDNGLAQLNNGIGQIGIGLNTLCANNASLTSGSSDVLNALKTIQTSLAATSVSADKISALVAGSGNIKNAIITLADKVALLEKNVNYASYKSAMNQNGLDIDTLKQTNEQTIAALTTQVSDLSQTIATMKGLGQDTTALEANAKQLTDIITLLTGNNAAIGGTEAYLNSVNDSITQLSAGIVQLKTSYAALDVGINEMATTLSGMLTNLTELKNGIDILVTKYAEFDGALGEYTTGVAQIAVGYSEIASGIQSLLNGSKNLNDGANTLNAKTTELKNGIDTICNGAEALKNGTTELAKSTAGMDEIVSEKIDDMISSITGENEKTVSFVDSRNENVDLVQFVIKTDSVKKAETTEPIAQPKETLTFWQKILRLFGLY